MSVPTIHAIPEIPQISPATTCPTGVLSSSPALGATVSASDTATGSATVLGTFPGAGSIRPGRTVPLMDLPASRAAFAQADDVLGIPLSRICADPDSPALYRPEIAAPAAVAAGLSALAVLRAHGVSVAAFAGYGVGELTALVAAGVLGAESALQLARRRGELLAAAIRERGTRPGGTEFATAVVNGLDVDTVRALCRSPLHWGTAFVAADEAPDRVIVTGTRNGLTALRGPLLAAGALDLVPPVADTGQCPLLGSVVQAFGAELDRHRFEEPVTPVLSSVDAEPVVSADHARERLRRQLVLPVRWAGTVRRALADGVAVLVEIGPGAALTGLARRIAPGVATATTSSPQSLEHLVARYAAAEPALARTA